MRTFLLMLICCLSFAQAQAADEKAAPVSLNSKEEWGKFFELCDRDWSAYETSLRTVREDLKKELTALPQKEYLERYGNDDPKIAFVSINWPSDLQSKDKGWESYKDCSDNNWAVRKSLADPSQDRRSRSEKIEVLKDCLVAREPKSGLSFPYERMLACYEKHAAQP